MVRFFETIALLSALLLTLSCGGDAEISGTGHGGEAVVIGTALAGDGSPAADVEITLAPKQYSSVEETEDLYRTKTDDSGNFTFIVEESGCFVLSGQKDSLFLYSGGVEIEAESENRLGELSFKKGTTVTVVPWWDKESSENLITVVGTPWKFPLSDSTFSITLPEEKLSFIRYETVIPHDSITLDLKETKVIGKEKLSSFGSIKAPNRAKTGEKIKLTVEPFTAGDRWVIDWGDKTRDTSHTGEAVHSYDKAGFYLIILYRENRAGTISKIPADVSEIVITDGKTENHP